MASSLALGATDLAICIVYMLSVLTVGLYFTLRERWAREKIKAQLSSGQDEQVLENYYLGGRKIPWWALAVADVSSYIDISGTMINTALVYALGIRGMYIEARGGLCLFLAFQLGYTGKLSRRCPVKTRAEWIKFRFGTDKQAVWLRTLIAITSMLSGMLMVTYFAVGGGKFVTEFIHIPAYLSLPSEFWAALGLMLTALVYTLASGFSSVVYTDVYQSFFIFASFTIVAVFGMLTPLPPSFTVYLPSLHSSVPVAQHVSYEHWATASVPHHLDVPSSSSYVSYEQFQIVIVSYLLLQMLRSSSGPGGSGLQTVLATKSEKEVRSQTFLAMLLLALRWAFSGGVAVLAIHATLQSPSTVIEPEKVVPFVIDQMLPVGIKGFVLASLLAAALTTFDTTINSSSAYWTVDIYQARLNPDATDKQLMWHARVSTLVVMLSGLFLSLYVNTINRVWGFSTVALAGGFVWPYFLSWYWARFNAISCLGGIVLGVGSAFFLFFFYPHMTMLSCLLITNSVSGAACIIICLVTEPTQMKTVRRFYKFARPPGMWSPIRQMCYGEETLKSITQENRTDLASTLLIGTVQVCCYMLAVSVVARAWVQSAVLGAIVALGSPLIYFKWYKKLRDYPVGMKENELLNEEE